MLNDNESDTSDEEPISSDSEESNSDEVIHFAMKKFKSWFHK